MEFFDVRRQSTKESVELISKECQTDIPVKQSKESAPTEKSKAKTFSQDPDYEKVTYGNVSFMSGDGDSRSKRSYKSKSPIHNEDPFFGANDSIVSPISLQGSIQQHNDDEIHTMPSIQLDKKNDPDAKVKTIIIIHDKNKEANSS